jgi:acetoin reductase-like protein
MSTIRKLPALHRLPLSSLPRAPIWSIPASRHRRTITTTPTPRSHEGRDRVAIVTGAARGIGRAIALRLAHDGYHITASDLPALQSQLDSLVSEITTTCKTKAHAHPADVTSPTEVASLVHSSAVTLGPLDTMVANAGIAHVTPLLHVTPEDFGRVFDVNVKGVHYCFQAAAKQMLSQEIPEGREIRGKLIAASSIVAFNPFPLMGAYSASKWAVRGLSQVYAKEMSPHKITANTYAPGIVATKMWELIDEEMGKRTGKRKGETFKQFCHDYIGLQRPSVPADVAGLVSFLGSKDADYITGQTYVVDGGVVFN